MKNPPLCCRQGRDRIVGGAGLGHECRQVKDQRDGAVAQDGGSRETIKADQTLAQGLDDRLDAAEQTVNSDADPLARVPGQQQLLAGGGHAVGRGTGCGAGPWGPAPPGR